MVWKQSLVGSSEQQVLGKLRTEGTPCVLLARDCRPDQGRYTMLKKPVCLPPTDATCVKQPDRNFAEACKHACKRCCRAEQPPLQVILPHESHGYRARESVMHALHEADAWMKQYCEGEQQVQQAQEAAEKAAPAAIPIASV